MVGVQTYSLDEVAAMVLPPEWTDGRRWLARRLNRGEIRGYRVGRVWRMTAADVEHLVQSRRRRSKLKDRALTTTPARSVKDGLSARSRRRLRDP